MVDVEIDFNGEKHIVSIKKLTWGEYSSVLKESMGKLRMIGSQTSAEMDYITFMEHLVLKSIERAPFDPTMENIRKLSPESFARLNQEAQKLNPLPL